MIDELKLRRFARLAAPLLRGVAAQGVGQRAAQDRAGPGLEFLDLRPYAAGEDARHIDWRQTVRRRKLLVRSYRDESASDWYLCVDASASMASPDKWQQAVNLATALAYAYLYAGHRVAIALFSDRVIGWCPPGRGQHHFATIVRELNATHPPARGGASLPGVCSGLVSRRGNLVLISDFLRDDAMAHELRTLRAGVATADAVQVLSKEELSISRTGPVTLYDVESDASVQLSVDDGAVTAAGRALAEHNDRLKRIMATLGIRFSSCNSGDSWEKILLKHLGR